MQILFLCSQNKQRSLTAEKLFDGYHNHRVRSAGTEANARIKVSAGLIGWADMIFCMEQKHARRIREKYADKLQDKKLICLNIPDKFAFMDEKLQQILQQKMTAYL
ncbi:MAG: protein tyrosine phosphatase [Neisseriaceae bacterium]|nr:protein tyrosine phosphatase [Neisseriaceae bacterium]MBQ9725529.1 protein tyrosine phosphatase [Neisseriaceae bacterium]